MACKEENLEIVRVFLAVGGFDSNAQNKVSSLYSLCEIGILTHRAAIALIALFLLYCLILYDRME